jgi:hypothetical protein
VDASKSALWRGAHDRFAPILLKKPLAVHFGRNVGNIIPIIDKKEE